LTGNLDPETEGAVRGGRGQPKRGASVNPGDDGPIPPGDGGTQDHPARMGDEFTYVQEDVFGEQDYVISGSPVGVYAFAPYYEGDAGTCYVTYFEFQVDSLTTSSVALNPVMYGPMIDYVVNGEVAPEYDLSSAAYQEDSGLCDLDALSLYSGKWFDTDDAVAGVDYYSFDYVYLPEGSSFDGVIIGFYDDTQVFYAPTFLDAPLP